MRQLVGEQVAVHAGVRATRRACAMPGASWPQPCGMLTTPGMMRVGDLDRHLEPRRRASARAPARRRRGRGGAASSGCTSSVQRGCRARAARGCASTSCSSAGRAGRRARCWPSPDALEPRAQPRRRRRRSPAARARSCPTACAAPRGCAAASGPRSMPCGLASSARERQAVGRRAEAVAVRPGAQHEVEQALRAAARRQRGQELVGLAPCDRRAGARRRRSRPAAGRRSRRARRGRRRAPGP